MKVIAWLLFQYFYRTIARRRRPDQFIGRGGWYMLRWWVFGSVLDANGEKVARRIAGRSYYLHCFLRPDHDVHHDHPWDWSSFLLKGPYFEYRNEPLQYVYAFNGAVEVQSTERRDYDSGTAHSLAHVERRYEAGSFLHGKAEDAHRVGLEVSAVVLPSDVYDMPWMSPAESWAVRQGRYTPAWSLFITGPWKRDWGFHCPKGWVFWRDFTDESGDGVDRGCGDKA